MSPKPGDIVRHKGTGPYPELEGHYGLVQTDDGDGIEWDQSPAYQWRDGQYGHALDGLLPEKREFSGWYVSPDDVEVL